jgi:hypothetical protein
MLSWERRHAPDLTWYHKREPEGGASQAPPSDILLLESDNGGGFDGLLFESSPPFGFDYLLLETAT